MKTHRILARAPHPRPADPNLSRPFSRWLGRPLRPFERQFIYHCERLRRLDKPTLICVTDSPARDLTPVILAYADYRFRLLDGLAPILLLAKTKKRALDLSYGLRARNPKLTPRFRFRPQCASIRAPDTLRGLSTSLALCLDIDRKITRQRLGRIMRVIWPMLHCASGQSPGNVLFIIQCRDRGPRQDRPLVEYNELNFPPPRTLRFQFRELTILWLDFANPAEPNPNPCPEPQTPAPLSVPLC